MHYVVGSGPSGIAAASALLEQGLHVTMLDMGQECDPARLRIVDQLAHQSPENWDPLLLAQIQGSVIGSAVPQKLCYGSNFPYGDDVQSPVDQDGTRCLYSFARGGLSNVWGASVLPAREDDFSDWPFTAESMAPHYTAVAKLLDIAGEHDELEADFPFHAPPAPSLNLSRQAQALLGRMRVRRERLARACRPVSDRLPLSGYLECRLPFTGTFETREFSLLPWNEGHERGIAWSGQGADSWRIRKQEHAELERRNGISGMRPVTDSSHYSFISERAGYPAAVAVPALLPVAYVRLRQRSGGGQ